MSLSCLVFWTMKMTDTKTVLTKVCDCYIVDPSTPGNKAHVITPGQIDVVVSALTKIYSTNPTGIAWYVNAIDEHRRLAKDALAVFLGEGK